MEEKKIWTWNAVYAVKKGLVNSIVEELGERTLDLSGENVKVFAIEHHCNEAIWGTLGTISASGFTLIGECDSDEEIRWHDMIAEDLAMILDYLLTGKW